MTRDQGIASRQGRLIGIFLEDDYTPRMAREAADELRAIETLPVGTVLPWTLTVDGTRGTFAPRPDGTLCDPLVLGALIEQNRADDEPCTVIVEASTVGGSCRRETPWPVEPEVVRQLLGQMAAAPARPNIPPRTGISTRTVRR